MIARVDFNSFFNFRRRQFTWKSFWDTGDFREIKTPHSKSAGNLRPVPGSSYWSDVERY